MKSCTKKWSLVLVALVMALALSITAAASSVTVDGVVNIIGAQDKDGNDLDVILEKLGSEDQKTVDYILQPKNLRMLLGGRYSEDMKAVDAFEFYVMVDDVKITEEEAGQYMPMKARFRVPGLLPDDGDNTAEGLTNLQIIHYYNGEWHVVENIINNGDGTVTVSLDNVGLLVFLAEGFHGPDVPGDEKPDDGGVSTGDSNSFGIMAAAAAASGAAIIVTLRKKVR